MVSLFFFSVLGYKNTLFKTKSRPMKPYILSILLFLLTLEAPAQDSASRGIPIHMIFESDGQYYLVGGYLKDGVFMVTSKPDSVFVSPVNQELPKKTKRKRLLLRAN